MTTFQSLLTVDVFIQVFGALLLFMVMSAVFQFSYILSGIGDEEK